MSRTQVSEWHKRFMEGREEVEDNECLGRPSTSKTEEHVEKIREIVDLRVKLLMKSTTWWSDEAPKTNEEENAGIVEEKIMDSASSQCASSQRPRGEAVFSR
jgi:hypothetical protein